MCLKKYRASLSLHEYTEALMCFQRVQELEPSNVSVVADLARLKRAMRQYKEARQDMSKRMVRQIFPKSSNTVSSPDIITPNEAMSKVSIETKTTETSISAGNSKFCCATDNEAGAYQEKSDKAGTKTVGDSPNNFIIENTTKSQYTRTHIVILSGVGMMCAILFGFFLSADRN